MRYVMNIVSISVLCSFVVLNAKNQWIYQDFDRSMKTSQFPQALAMTERIIEGVNGYELYIFFKRLYLKHNLSELRKKGIDIEKKIPPVIHQIWIGGPLPEAFTPLCESWKHYHPGWFYKLWTDDDVASLDLYNKSFFDQSDNPGVRSDLMKWEIIHKFGGFYLDVDYECLASLEELRCYDFITAIQPLDSQFLQLGAAFFAAPAGHPILQHCIETIKDDWHHKGAPKKSGPVHFTKSFFKTAGKDGRIDIALPASYAYPLGCTQKITTPEGWQAAYQYWAQQGGFMVHHWAKSWMPKQYRFQKFRDLGNDKETQSWND